MSWVSVGHWFGYRFERCKCLIPQSWSVISSVSVYNGFGLQNKSRDGPLHNEKARGCFSAQVGSVKHIEAGPGSGTVQSFHPNSETSNQLLASLRINNIVTSISQQLGLVVYPLMDNIHFAAVGIGGLSTPI